MWFWNCSITESTNAMPASEEIIAASHKNQQQMNANVDCDNARAIS
jgi:hypothetical protein